MHRGEIVETIADQCKCGIIIIEQVDKEHNHRSGHLDLVLMPSVIFLEIHMPASRNRLYSNVLNRQKCAMGNESTKSSTKERTSERKKINFGLKSGPSLSTIQRHLENAQKSRVLQLRNCGLKSLPEQLQEVHEFLRNLDVSQNKIRTVPTFIGMFSNLKQLHLPSNQLECLPDEIGLLKKLEIFDLSCNELNVLPESLTGLSSLKALNLSKNKFTHLPVCVCHIATLDNLDMSCNFIEFLPEEVKFLTVSELNLNQNRLNSLNADSLVQCQKLKTLRVEENCLNKTEFSSEFLTNSTVCLIAYAGNLFQDKDFQSLPGYEEYQTRYTATKRKM